VVAAHGSEEDHTRGAGGLPAPMRSSHDWWPHGDTKDLQDFCRRLPPLAVARRSESPLLRRRRYLPLPQALAGICGRSYGDRPGELRLPRSFEFMKAPIDVHDHLHHRSHWPFRQRLGVRSGRHPGTTRRGAVADTGLLRTPRPCFGGRGRTHRLRRFPGHQPCRRWRASMNRNFDTASTLKELDV